MQAVFPCDTDHVIKICHIMTTITNPQFLRKYETRLCLIVEQTLSFTLSTNLFIEIEAVSPNFEQIA